MPQPWILSIDFGTSYTLVAAKQGDRTPEVVEVGGERRMPSVVMVEATGNIVVGRTADDLSGSNPSNTLRAPKNRLGDQAPVVLGGRPYQVVQLVAALLRNVYDEAVSQMDGPPTEVRLTHPAVWNRPRLNRLLEAAAKAGLPNTALVPEPVAAALSYASESGVEEGGHLVVYDLGGGTFDTAVVTARRGGFVVEGRPGGDQNIGGELFDELVMNHVGQQLPPEAWEQLQVADEPTWQQVGASLRKEARRAKETLSSHPYADLLVPLPDGLVQVRITRDEFEQIVGPYVDETVNLLRRCITDAGVEEAAVDSIYLVGGASRSPIVERLVKAAFPNVHVSRRGDPKTSVALGAARAVRSGSTPAPGSGSTQGASAPTAEQGLVFGPSVEPVRTGGCNQPAVIPTGSDQPAEPAADRAAPGGRQLPPAPVPRHTSNPPSAGAVSNPPTVTTAAGAGSVPPTTPSYLGSAPSRPAASGPPKSRWNAKMLALIALGAVLIGAIIGFVVLQATDSGSTDTTTTTDESTTEPGEPADPEDVVLQLADVENQFPDATWTEQEPADPDVETDTFCDFTSPSDEVDEVVRVYNDAADTYVYNSIFEYTDADAALRTLGRDQAIVANCVGQHPYTLGGVDYTAELTDATAALGDTLGPDTAAVGYLLTPPADQTDLQPISGYIIEWRQGKYIVGTEISVDGRVPTQDEKDQFTRLVQQLFERSADLQ